MESPAPHTSHSTRYTTLLRSLLYIVGGIGLLLVAGIAVLYFTLRNSLPRIDGELSVPALASEATIERDSYGVPTIRAETRRDLAFATGVAHAQDRFFQMDLMRRAAAGELAALLGPSLIETDKSLRLHRFRSIASQVLLEASPAERDLLTAYTSGVNFVLETDSRAWEYRLLRAQPAAWQAEDSVLAAFSMYLNLNDSNGKAEIARARLRETLPAGVFAFLHPVGTAWDAPIVGGTWRAPPIPGADVFDLRSQHTQQTRSGQTQSRQRRSASRVNESRSMHAWPDLVSIFRSQALGFAGPVTTAGEAMVGSNSWAVAGSHTATGSALLANDMHLGLRLPNVWYQARLIVDTQSAERRDLVGVTLPGLPLMIVGSNGRVAWSYTNSYGDWTDVVRIETDPEDADRYMTADGSKAFEVQHEIIEVHGAEPVEYRFKTTRWGPLLEDTLSEEPLALAWTAHRPHATNLHMFAYETAVNVEDILLAANRAGAPVQNFVAADAQGHIGWSLMGQVPKRGNYDSTVPSYWREEGTGWTGWQAPHEYPRVIDPPSARLWTANARTLDAQSWLAFLGDGGYDLGARAAQIRDGLLALPAASAQDMVRIQLDDRALFLARWRDLLLELLEAPGASEDPLRAQARELVTAWSGRASTEDVGYRIVRTFRNQVRSNVFASFTQTALAKFPSTHFSASTQFEGPLWALVTQRPEHLLEQRHETWEAALLSAFDEALESMKQSCTELSTCTWGRENTLTMRHPMSSALSFLSHWLDMPAVALNGDAAMPRVQSTSFGASQRLVVSPGREHEALFQMPGGQVDHPLSRFYGAGHEAWVRGEPRPLLPGKSEHVLRLLPQE